MPSYLSLYTADHYFISLASLKETERPLGRLKQSIHAKLLKSLQRIIILFNQLRRTETEQPLGRLKQSIHAKLLKSLQRIIIYLISFAGRKQNKL